MRVKSNSQARLSKTTVIVIGAGFSKDLGYPLTRELLIGLPMSASLSKVFERVVKFHHPDWNGRRSTLPDVETLLTEWTANEELLPSLRPKGPFTAQDLRQLRHDLLGEIANWFHAIHKKTNANRDARLQKFAQFVGRMESPVIISFNWDYELDRIFCRGRPRREVYGLDRRNLSTPILLKPHGSLNWYEFNPGKHITEELRETLWEDKKHQRNARFCFVNWRAPKSTRRLYVPWIVPPTHAKNFRHRMLRTIWRRCVDYVSVAREIYFLGYSLPLADWHSRYIFRCGFHNQIEGRPLDNGGREKRTGHSRVYVVNPDESVRKRIEAVAGYKSKWIPERVSRWLKDLD